MYVCNVRCMYLKWVCMHAMWVCMHVMWSVCAYVIWGVCVYNVCNVMNDQCWSMLACVQLARLLVHTVWSGRRRWGVAVRGIDCGQTAHHPLPSRLPHNPPPDSSGEVHPRSVEYSSPGWCLPVQPRSPFVDRTHRIRKVGNNSCCRNPSILFIGLYHHSIKLMLYSFWGCQTQACLLSHLLREWKSTISNNYTLYITRQK